MKRTREDETGNDLYMYLQHLLRSNTTPVITHLDVQFNEAYTLMIGSLACMQLCPTTKITVEARMQQPYLRVDLHPENEPVILYVSIPRVTVLLVKKQLLSIKNVVPSGLSIWQTIGYDPSIVITGSHKVGGMAAITIYRCEYQVDTVARMFKLSITYSASKPVCFLMRQFADETKRNGNQRFLGIFMTPMSYSDTLLSAPDLARISYKRWHHAFFPATLVTAIEQMLLRVRVLTSTGKPLATLSGISFEAVETFAADSKRCKR